MRTASTATSRATARSPRPWARAGTPSISWGPRKPPSARRPSTWATATTSCTRRALAQRLPPDGGEGNDTFRGGSGNDLLRGGAGADEFFGQAGADTMLGGEGDDNFAASA